MGSKVQCGSISRAASIALALVVLLFAVVATPWVQAQEYSFCLVYSFKGGATDGSQPYGGVVLDTAGNLYGTTLTGGYQNSFGTVFKVGKGCDQPGKNDTVLHYFNPTKFPNDGNSPYDGLVLKAGNLYGTTLSGGTHDNSGIVFKVSTKAGGPYEVVFNLFPGDGSNPRAGLVRDSAGNFYGTTIGQGQNFAGTVFKVGRDTPVHIFGGTYKGKYPDGSTPYARLALDAAGNLIGTTRFGGAYANGTVFLVNKTGTFYKILYSFEGPDFNDGSDPYGGVVLDSAGNIYGTTRNGGAYGYGTVYKLNSKGGEIALYNFNSTNGQAPDGDLVLDSHGNVWGTTETGGQYGSGVVFELDNKLQQRIFLYSLFGNSDGAAPYAGLTLDSAGNLYGTTLNGGPNFNGTVFKLCPGGCQ